MCEAVKISMKKLIYVSKAEAKGGPGAPAAWETGKGTEQAVGVQLQDVGEGT
jgi:hypothetical protein